MQSKGSIRGTKHVIKNGKMKHFIVEHIPKKSVCIEDIPYKSDNKTTPYWY